MAKPATKPKQKAKPEPPRDRVEFFDVRQNSEEWLELRRGILTASNFAIMMREDNLDGDPSKTRTKLLYRLAGERLSGRVDETFRSEAMKRGQQMEPAALEYYGQTNFDAKVERIGFVRRTIVTPLGREIVVGASPDAKVGPSKGLEIKTLKPDLLIAQAKRGKFPPEHRAQVHGTMLVSDWIEMDLQLFYEGMPIAPKYTVLRDESYVAEMRAQIEIFDYELGQLVRDIKKMGSV